MNAYNHETSPLNTPTAEAAKILVIRFMAVGDVVLSSVLCNSLKKTFPKAQVDYLVHDNSASLFENHPYIDNVIGLSKDERKNPFKYWRKIREITAQGYDLVVDAQSTNKSEFISLFARKRAICIGRVKKGRGFFYTNKVNPKAGGGNKLAERLRLLEPLIAMGFDVKHDEQFVINTPMALKNELRASMEAAGVNFNRPVFLMSVTAKERDMRWSMDKMQAWAQYAIDAYNAQLVLFSGSSEEQAEVEAFYQAMGEHPDVYPRINSDSLPKLTALMSHCDLFFGNEGGPRHLAQACGLPSAVLFSPWAKKTEWLVSDSALHQGVEWDDVADIAKSEIAAINEILEVGSEQYWELYRSLKPEHAIEILDAVAEAAGIPLRKA